MPQVIPTLNVIKKAGSREPVQTLSPEVTAQREVQTLGGRNPDERAEAG